MTKHELKKFLDKGSGSLELNERVTLFNSRERVSIVFIYDNYVDIAVIRHKGLSIDEFISKLNVSIEDLLFEYFISTFGEGSKKNFGGR